MQPFHKSPDATSLLEHGRVILAHGEVTGHCHEVIATTPCDLPAADFFQEPDSRRVLLVLRPCVLTHPEHGAIAIDPAHPIQVRQGDILLHPIGLGAWHVIRQREYSPSEVRNVAD